MVLRHYEPPENFAESIVDFTERIHEGGFVMFSVAITNIGLIALIGFGIYATGTCWPLAALVFLQFYGEGRLNDEG